MLEIVARGAYIADNLRPRNQETKAIQRLCEFYNAEAIVPLNGAEKFLGIFVLSKADGTRDIAMWKDEFQYIAKRAARIIEDLRNYEKAKIGIKITAARIQGAF